MSRPASATCLPQPVPSHGRTRMIGPGSCDAAGQATSAPRKTRCRSVRGPVICDGAADFPRACLPSSSLRPSLCSPPHWDSCALRSAEGHAPFVTRCSPSSRRDSRSPDRNSNCPQRLDPSSQQAARSGILASRERKSWVEPGLGRSTIVRQGCPGPDKEWDGGAVTSGSKEEAATVTSEMLAPPGSAAPADFVW